MGPHELLGVAQNKLQLQFIHFAFRPLTLEGNLSKSTLLGSMNFTVKKHRYAMIVVCRCNLDGLVKTRVMHPMMLFSTPWGFCR